MSEQNKSVVKRYFEEVCNGRKLDVADEIFAATHVYHDPGSPMIGGGPEGQKELISMYVRAFPDARWTIDELIAVEDRVITRWTGAGTHQGDLLGVAPTGKSVRVQGVWIQRIANGKITESWNFWDTLGMMQQLGVVPAFGATKAGRA